MTLSAELRQAAATFHKNEGYEAELMLLAALTLETALRSLLLDEINEATYMDLISLLEGGAK